MLSSVYSTPGHMLEVIEFMCGIFIGLLLPLIYVKKFAHVVHIWNLKGMFVMCTYIAMVW